MPAPYVADTSPVTVGNLRGYVVTFEAAARAGVVELSSYAAGWLALEREAAALGVPLARALGATVYEQNRAANARTVRLCRALQLLDGGRAELVAYRVDADPRVRFAIAPPRSVPLGIWPYVPVLLAVAKGALIATLAALGAYVADAWIDMQETRAAVQAAQQANVGALTALVATLPPDQRAAVAAALARVQGAIAAPPPGWLDSLAASVQSAAGAVGSVASSALSPLLILAALWFFSRNGKSKKEANPYGFSSGRLTAALHVLRDYMTTDAYRKVEGAAWHGEPDRVRQLLNWKLPERNAEIEQACRDVEAFAEHMRPSN